jgi:Fe(3+) dicitrate transport protein
VVSRLNVSYGLGRASTALLWSSVSDQFTDANNTVMSDDANVGKVPAYQLLDWSTEYRFGPRTRLGVGVTNVANHRYLTLRTTEYPGPGIIPGLARTAYLTIRVGM